MMKINRVQIKNYRNLKDIDVTLGNIVTLIGENNSGKSNFLRALSLPLSSEDTNSNKRLSWYDINKDAKKQYYDFIKENRKSIIEETIDPAEFLSHVPTVTVKLYIQPDENEHYNVNDILCHEEGEDWLGGILYKFYVNRPEDLLNRVKHILSSEADDTNIKMSLLPVECYTYSLTVPSNGHSIPYDVLSNFRSSFLPAERDDFSSSAENLGSRMLANLFQKKVTPDSQAKIEKKYSEFFDMIQTEGKLDTILNWQNYSEIPNAKDFFQEISILPNMPLMSKILGSVRLGYADGHMFEQGLGHRNLVFMAVLLNSYINKERDISFRLITVEEPEAHLCNSNILLMISLFNVFCQKNKYTQIVYSTHNTEFVNKIGLENVIVFHNGLTYNLSKELSEQELDYLAANPNTGIFKLLYSKKVILIEGITEELLIKSYLQTRKDLNDIQVLSFHKGFTKIIDIWQKINAGNENRLGVVRDFDNQPKAQAEHEKKETKQIIVRTTKGYTLETDITNLNYDLLREKYGDEYGWSTMNADQIQSDWRLKKSDVMLRICHDLIAGDLDGFVMPRHIQDIINFMQGDFYEG